MESKITIKYFKKDYGVRIFGYQFVKTKKDKLKMEKNLILIMPTYMILQFNQVKI